MRGRRILLIAAAILVLLLGGLVAAAALIPEERVANAVAVRAEALLGQPVSLDRVGLSFFPLPGVRLAGLTVGADDSTALARLDRLELRVRLIPLLGGHVVVRSLELDRPRIAIEIDGEGVTNFPVMEAEAPAEPAGEGDTGSAQPSTANIAFAVDRIRITDGAVRYAHHGQGARVRLSGWNQELAITGQVEAGQLSGLSLAGQLSFDDIAATLPDVVLPARDLALRVTHDAELDLGEDRLDLRSLEIDFDGVTVGGTGRVRGVNSGRPDVHLELGADGLDADGLMAWVPDSVRARLALPDGRPVELRGTAAIEAVVDGTLAPDALPAVDGTLTLGDVAVTVASDALLEAVNGRVAFSLDSVVARFDGRALGEGFNAGVALRDPATPQAVVAVSGRADLGRLVELGLVPDTLGLEGAIRMNLRVQVPTEALAETRPSGTIDVSGLAITGASPVVRVPTATARFDGGRVRLHPVEIELGPDRAPVQLDITADGWIPAAVDSAAPPPRVAAVLEGGTLDLDALFGSGADGEAEDGAGEAAEDGGYPALLFARLRDRPIDGRTAAEAAEAAGLALPPLPPVEARFEARVEAVVRNDLQYTDLRVTARATPAAVTLEELRFGLMGGHVDMNGRVTLARADSAGVPVETRVAGRFGLTDVAAASFFDTLTPFKGHLAGRLAMAGTVDMTLDRHALPVRSSVQAGGSLAIADGRLANWTVLQAVGDRLGIATFDTLRFRDWAGSFRIDGPRATLDESALDGTGLDLRASGWFDFGGQLDLQATAGLEPELARQAGAIGQQLVATGHRVPVGLRIHGPVEDPEVALDLTPAREAIAALVRSAADQAQEEAEERVRQAAAEAEAEARQAAEQAEQAARDAAREAAEGAQARAEEELQEAADRATEEVAERVELPDSLRDLPADSLRQILGDSAYALLPDSVRLRADSLQEAIQNAIRERLRRLLPGGGGGDGGGPL